MFISFEGTEGSGKSTQVKAVYAALQAASYDVLLTREPGGTDIGNQIRKIVLDTMSNTQMQARAELLLFCASRAQLVGEVIRPTLAKGGIILCDRYADSTLAYQGYGHGLPIDDLKQILQFATSGLYPDMTIYLDLLPEKGLARRREGTFEGEDWNRLDDMEIAFHHRVYQGYQSIIANDKQRFVIVDADQAPTAITKVILDAIMPRLASKTEATK
ncbi:MAG: dTMP kinase [Anaerolineae bacterium]|nr:dTMP kinase [Anaerolineae bacterium]